MAADPVLMPTVVPATTLRLSAPNRDEAMETQVYRIMRGKGHNILYREAGPKVAPTFLLRHGLPSSSRMFQPVLPFVSPPRRVEAVVQAHFLKYPFRHIACRIVCQDPAADGVSLSRSTVKEGDTVGLSEANTLK